MEACSVLGYEPVVIGLHRKSKGEKAHLDITQGDLDNFHSLFQNATVVGVRNELRNEALSLLKDAFVYVSLDSPSVYLGFDFPRSPWVQVQYGASDLLFSVARAHAKADAFGLWGKNWIDPGFIANPRILSELRAALGYITSKPNAVLGNVTLPNIDFVTSPDNNFPARVTYFEPHVLSRSQNFVRDLLSIGRFSTKFAAERQIIGAQLGQVAAALKPLSYETIYRVREKTLPAPLGQKYFVGPPSRRDQLLDIQESKLVIGFSPSVSALESLWFGRKVIQLDSRHLIPSGHDNFLTPNHLMYESLSEKNKEFLRTPDIHGDPNELAAWISGYPRGKVPYLDGWSDRGVNVPEALDSLIWRSRRT